MPDKWKGNEFTDDLIIIDGENLTRFGQYDFKSKVWEDTTTWSDIYGYCTIDNVKMWAYAPSVGN